MSRAARLLGAVVAFVVALGALAGAAWLVAPPEALATLGLGTVPDAAATTGGWGNSAATPATPAAQTTPLIDLSGLSWMAWTSATGAFFLCILGALATMTGLELGWPGGHPRRGAFGLDTTRGDRLFISLLGSAWLCLLWLGLIGAPLWGALALCAAWAVFVFWRV